MAIITKEEFEKPRYYFLDDEKFDLQYEHFLINHTELENSVPDYAWVLAMGGIVGGALLEYVIKNSKEKEKRLTDGTYLGVVFDEKSFCVHYDLELEAVWAVIEKFVNHTPPYLLKVEFFREGDSTLLWINRSLLKKRVEYIAQKFFHLRKLAEFEGIDWANSDPKPEAVPADDNFLSTCQNNSDLDDWLSAQQPGPEGKPS